MSGLMRFLAQTLRGLVVLVGAALLTITLFLVLPLMQTIARGPATDLVKTVVDTADIPPPPPPIEEEPEEEEEEEEEPPELEEETEPLDLSELELALGIGSGEGWLEGDFALKLDGLGANGDPNALFSLADLDQAPRAVYQPGPTYGKDVRRKAPGSVWVIFIVDEQGRVQSPRVQRSTDPVFEKPALAAVKQWKFEPGKRNGQAVSTRTRVRVTFPKEG